MDKYIKFFDEQGNQIMNDFKCSWGCPVGAKIVFGGLGYFNAIKRIEKEDGSLEITVRKKVKG
jgi:hypothetical protein